MENPTAPGLPSDNEAPAAQHLESGDVLLPAATYRLLLTALHHASEALELVRGNMQLSGDRPAPDIGIIRSARKALVGHS